MTLGVDDKTAAEHHHRKPESNAYGKKTSRSISYAVEVLD